MQSILKEQLINRKSTGYLLIILTYILFLITFSVAFYSENTTVINDVKSLIMSKTAPTISIIGIALILFFLIVLFQVFVGTYFLYLILRFIFRVESKFTLFFRVILLWNITFVLGALYNVLVFSNSSYGILVYLTNPLFILGFVLLSYLLRTVLQATLTKALLFSSFLYISFLIMTLIGGI
ncbi:hypothetical protein BC351_38405 [Paenibacillus ferrarius]|uniref:Yip1 domain-containing protein n=1 Tax=Paenibacillus ferrarius TaxID=1469647 RepID=A0A1V4HAN9_9BACL|nr:hypothetical protein [Paenibacillus ferrarius]OPH48271.1 hypothetical protein BC351_38405 [Paenibacillus ferrarius]